MSASPTDDPVLIADVLIEKTNSILSRLDKDWNDDKNGNNAMEDIEKDLETYREVASSKRSSWRTELMQKISKLEKELQELKFTQVTTIAQKTDSEYFLDIVSSRTPSPLKNKTFRKKPNVEAKVLKSNLKETERIMDRGFRTARELNEKIEELKAKRKKNIVSPASSKSVNERTTSSDNDTYIRGLAEDVTSLLVQRDVRKAAKSRVNTRNLVIVSQDERRDEIPIRRRLVVQKLPDNHIRAPLTLQTLPSVDIAPDINLPSCSTSNARVYIFQHESPKPQIKQMTKKVEKLEIGVQAELSEKSQSDKVDRLIAQLGQKYRNEIRLNNGNDIKELSKDVEASKQKLSQRQLSSIAIKSSTPKQSHSEEYKSDFEVESLVTEDGHSKSLDKNSSLKISSKTTSLSEDESLIEAQMKRLGLSATRKTRKSSDDNNLVYVKKNGQYLPVEQNESPKFQIIMPEIVLRIPETAPVKQDQIVQTDEGFATLTSADTSSVVDQLNKRFERTEALLQQIGQTNPIGHELLRFLNKRKKEEISVIDHRISPDEKGTKHSSRRRHKKEMSDDDLAQPELLNSSQSIGEVR